MNVQECYAQFHGDYANAKMRLMNDAIIERFLKKFLTDNTMSELMEAVKAQDIDASFRAAHTLKGVAANMAFTELWQHATALTEQLRPRQRNADHTLLQALQKSYNLVINTIRYADES